MGVKLYYLISSLHDEIAYTRIGAGPRFMLLSIYLDGILNINKWIPSLRLHKLTKSFRFLWYL